MTHQYSHLLPPSWKSDVVAWLDEDAPSFGYGGFVVGEAQLDSGTFLLGRGSKRNLDCRVEWHVVEVTSEHVALNILARCGGIATIAKRTKNLAQAYGFRGTITGTRKTTPGFRFVEKYIIVVGGIDPHRFDLFTMIMLKDDHIWSAGLITVAIARARKVGAFLLLSDVKMCGEEEANEGIVAGANIIMLINIEGNALDCVARCLRERWKGEGRKFLPETNGGISEANLYKRAITEINILSTSSAHQSVPHTDFDLKIQMLPG